MLARHSKRGGVRCAIKEIERGHQLRGVPRDLSALCRLVDAETNAGKQIFRSNAPFSHHLGQSLGVGRIRPCFIRCYCARRSIEGDQHALLGFNERQATCERRARFSEGIAPRHIENHQAGPEFERGKRHRIIRQSQRFGRHIDVAGYPGIDRRKVVFSFKLQSVSTEINKRDGFRSRGRRLIQKFPESAPQSLLIEIPSPGDVEAGGLKCLSDQTGIVRGSGQCPGLIIRIANNQSDAPFGGPGLGDRSQNKNAKHQNQFKCRSHDRPTISKVFTHRKSVFLHRSGNALNEC